jgi:hypothetical protein
VRTNHGSSVSSARRSTARRALSAAAHDQQWRASS